MSKSFERDAEAYEGVVGKTIIGITTSKSTYLSDTSHIHIYLEDGSVILFTNHAYSGGELEFYDNVEALTKEL